MCLSWILCVVYGKPFSWIEFLFAKRGENMSIWLNEGDKCLVWRAIDKGSKEKPWLNPLIWAHGKNKLSRTCPATFVITWKSFQLIDIHLTRGITVGFSLYNHEICLGKLSEVFKSWWGRVLWSLSKFAEELCIDYNRWFFFHEIVLRYLQTCYTVGEYCEQVLASGDVLLSILKNNFVVISGEMQDHPFLFSLLLFHLVFFSLEKIAIGGRQDDWGNFFEIERSGKGLGTGPPFAFLFEKI